MRLSVRDSGSVLVSSASFNSNLVRLSAAAKFVVPVVIERFNSNLVRLSAAAPQPFGGCGRFQFQSGAIKRLEQKKLP